MSDEEDDCVSFGTKLKEFVEGEKIRKRPISVEEQIVKDKNGKRRFHGAFTGGFSAGFFNTVDTPQGWTPAQFKSSRDSRADADRAQRPEDFMDDEDFGDFGFAPHKLKTKSNFQSKNSEEPSSTENKDLLSPALRDLIQPARSTVGETLLRTQGWKPGQGIGPKTVKQVKKDKLNSYVRTYVDESGCPVEEDDPNLEKYKDFLFAPDELPVCIAKPKEDLFGIGYHGLERHGTVKGQSAFELKSGLDKKKFSISGEAFGVGIYEDDDDDVYSRNEMAQYDFSLDVSGSDRGKGKHSGAGASKSVSDLTQVLEGFVLSTRKSKLKKSFPPPVIPRDWRPKKFPRQRNSRFEEVSSQEPVRIANPTVEQRRSMLFPERKREEVKEEVVVKEEPCEGEEPPTFLSDPNAKSSSHSSFRPFQANPEKQKRYEQFLVCIENNRRDALKILQPKTMTEWERERERVEFERAAHLYKPMQLSMASRFVSAAGTSKDQDAGTSTASMATQEKREAVDLKMFGKLTRNTEDWIPARILCIRFNVKNPHGEDKEPKSRKKNNFGSSQLFSILGDQSAGGGSQGSRAEENNENNGDSKVKDSNLKIEPAEETREVPNDSKLVKDEEVVKTERPPMDLFKAIFANSDSGSSSDEEPEVDEKVPQKVVSRGDSSGESESSEDTGERRSKSKSDRDIGSRGQDKSGEISTGAASGRTGDPASGIFAGINFDKFIKRRRKTPPPVVREKIAPKRPKSILDQSVRTILGIKSGDTSDGEYGPALPPPVASSQKIVISSDSDSDEWEERKKSKKKKHKKEKKKKKKKSKKKDF